MEIAKIKQLVAILEKSTLQKIEINDSEFSILLEKPQPQMVNMTSIPQVHVQPQVTHTNQEDKQEEVKPENTIKSPLVGTFYSKPSPDKPAFVEVGKEVKAGDVVCIIEAMKVMNEIKATESGVIAKCLLSDGDIVEFDQPIFVIK